MNKPSILFHLLLLLITVFTWGCSDCYEIDEASYSSECLTKSNYGSNSRKWDLTEAVYHLLTGAWIIPQKDPYDLNRLREACKLLAVSPEDVQIVATHYAVKFFPKDEKEQWRIELAEGVSVDYTPFGYESVPYDLTKELDAEPKNSEQILDDCRNIVTYTSLTDDGISIEESYKIPVLYTVWPVEKPLPCDIEYEVDHAVFIPDYLKGGYDENQTALLKAIEREAIHLALGVYPAELSNPARSNDVITLQGYVYHYDSLCDSLIGLHNLKIRFQLGSNCWDTYVQQSGLFSITDEISTAATYKHVFQHPKWKLTNNNSTNPLTVNWGVVSDRFNNSIDTLIITSSYPDVRYSVLPAVNFYYNGSHYIRTWYYDEGIRIIIPGVIGDNVSEFYFTESPTYIKVYENKHNDIGKLTGAVLHEFGHFTMYCECGGYNDYMINYYGIDRLLRESYASYVGWYLAKTMYASWGYTESPPSDFSAQSRQDWVETNYSSSSILKYYSPLFVDLVDNFNQHDIDTSYNNDSIVISANVHLRIREMAAQCKTWDDIKAYLDDYIGIHYTQSQFNSFCAYYNYWYEHI